MEPTVMTAGRVRPLECLSDGVELLRGHYWVFVAICGVGTLLGGLAPMGILMGPMMCGIYLAFFRRMEGAPVRFEDLFRGFDHFVQSLIVSLLIFAISFVLTLPAVGLIFGAGLVGASSIDRPGPTSLLLPGALLIVALLLVAIALLVGPFFLFAYALIVDRHLSAIEAVKTSIAAVRANLWSVSLVLLLTGAFWLAGALLCYLPVFLVAPLCYATMAVTYRRIFPRQG